MKKQIILLLSVSLGLGLLTLLLSYWVGYNEGYQKGKVFITQTYDEKYRTDLGDLLDQRKYLMSLKGQITNIEDHTLSFQNGRETLKVTLDEQATYIKGPDASGPAGMHAGSYQDLKVGGKVYLSAYLLDKQKLHSYQIFIFE